MRKPDSAGRALVRMEPSERQVWCNRAAELGCPSEKIKNSDRITEVFPWSTFVADEMKGQGLWDDAEEVKQQKEVMLPVWADDKRGLPNDLLRCNIFSATKIVDNKMVKKQLMNTVDGVEILYTGSLLDTYDLRVWEQLLHIARKKPLMSVCEFTAYEFLEAINVGTSAEKYEWLSNSFDRLMSGIVYVRKGKLTYGCGLVRTCLHDEETGKYKLILEDILIDLFVKGGWTALKLDHINNFRNKPLARWLNNYYATHAKPHPVKVATIMGLCGSKNKNLFSFRQQLKKALDALIEANTIIEWSINDETDIISVIRGSYATLSQQRYLEKNAGK